MPSCSQTFHLSFLAMHTCDALQSPKFHPAALTDLIWDTYLLSGTQEQTRGSLTKLAIHFQKAQV